MIRYSHKNETHLDYWMRPQWRKRNSRKGRGRSIRGDNEFVRRVLQCKGMGYSKYTWENNYWWKRYRIWNEELESFIIIPIKKRNNTSLLWVGISLLNIWSCNWVSLFIDQIYSHLASQQPSVPEKLSFRKP